MAPDTRGTVSPYIDTYPLALAPASSSTTDCRLAPYREIFLSRSLPPTVPPSHSFNILLTISVAALMAGFAIASPLTTISPCPNATSMNAPPINVTQQHQTVSTCSTTSACIRVSCITNYPVHKYAYVSTVIPAAWDGMSMHLTTITATSQTVTVSRFHTVITTWTAPAVKSGTAVGSPTPVYPTVARDYMVPYNKIGPLGIPGYGGSGLCKECRNRPDGSRSQVVDVVECRSGPADAKCMGYRETWVSKPAPSSSSTTVVPVSTRFVAPSAATYTFTFTMTTPSRVITAAGQSITVASSPYFHPVTRACRRPKEVVDFTVTVTKTIYWTVPCASQRPKTSSAVPVPTGSHAFPRFHRPEKGSSQSKINDQGNAYGWSYGVGGNSNSSATATSTRRPTATGGPKRGSTSISHSTSRVTDTSAIGVMSGPYLPTPLTFSAISTPFTLSCVTYVNSCPLVYRVLLYASYRLV